MIKVLSDIYSDIRGLLSYVLDDECRLIDEVREHLQDKRYTHMSDCISCFFTSARQK
jgi:hypothetical protein